MQVLFEGEVKPDEVKIYRGFQIKDTACLWLLSKNLNIQECKTTAIVCMRALSAISCACVCVYIHTHTHNKPTRKTKTNFSQQWKHPTKHQIIINNSVSPHNL